MPIPEAQLEVWSRQGSVIQSKNTYASIKKALEDADAPYKDRNFKVFLQGSYGNDTNIYAESDVDIVIRYNGSFYYQFHEVPNEQQKVFDLDFPSSGTYPYSQFKAHVNEALVVAFGKSVDPTGTKTIRIKPEGARRSADVVVAFEFRRYYKYFSSLNEGHVEGIAFFSSDGTRIDNFPEQHSANCTSKHQAANNNYKPMVRIFKNMRSKMVNDGLLNSGVAPSYFIEGLLYNVPNWKFWGTYQEIVYNILKWLDETPDRSQFTCANDLYYLLRDGSKVCWPVADGAQFVNAVTKLWNDWK